MSGQRRLTDAEREAIAADVRDGMSVQAASRKHGCGASTVSRIVRAAGIDVAHAAAQRARNAARDYDQAERLAIVNEAFDALRAALPKVSWDSANPRDLIVGLGILVDKRRLEDGLSTDRTETVRPDQDRLRELRAADPEKVVPLIRKAESA